MIISLLTREELKRRMLHKIIRANGTKERYKNGQLHNDNVPAIEGIYERKMW
jgi:hypothetical protein